MTQRRPFGWCLMKQQADPLHWRLGAHWLYLLDQPRLNSLPNQSTMQQAQSTPQQAI
ncbi:MAG: hypothetical protein SNJ57_02245 [Cyanobacteriota bacterium]